MGGFIICTLRWVLSLNRGDKNKANNFDTKHEILGAA